MTNQFILLTSKKLIILLFFMLEISISNLYPQQLETTKPHLKKQVSDDDDSNARDYGSMHDRRMVDYDGRPDIMDKESFLNLEPSGDESEVENQLDSAIATMLQEALYSDVTTQSSENRSSLKVYHEPQKDMVSDSSILVQDNTFKLKNKNWTEDSDNTKNESVFYVTPSKNESSMSSKLSLDGAKQDGHRMKNELHIDTDSYISASWSQPTMSSSISYDFRIQDRHEMKNKSNIKNDSYSSAPWSQSVRSSKSSFDDISLENFETNEQTSVQSTNQKSAESIIDNVEPTQILKFLEVPDEINSSKSVKHITMQTPAFSAMEPKNSTVPKRNVRDEVKHKVQRVPRKEPKVKVLVTKNTNVESKTWKSAVKVGNSEILPHNLRSDLKAENLVAPLYAIAATEKTVSPEKACEQKNVTCEKCKATAPQCHYNFTGQFCFYSSIIHKNDIYECGTRYVASDDYGPVMAVVCVLALGSLGVAVYLASATIQKRRSAALTREEVDAMLQQVQFVRDRRTNM